MATRNRTSIVVGSQEIVAWSTRSLLEQQNHPEKVAASTVQQKDERLAATGTFEGTSVIDSLMPQGVSLNARGTGAVVQGLREDVATVEPKRPRQEIPTADLVVRNSFKVGTKLLIKIERTKNTTKIPDHEPQLVFDKFSLQAIAESDSERYQLQETFEENVLYLFGRRPRVWTMQGIVLNGRRAPEASADEDIAKEAGDIQGHKKLMEARLKKDMDWANRLLMNWENYYRGSKAIEARCRTYLAYDDTVIEATLLELVMARNAQVPTAVNATLTFAVHQRAFMGQEYIDGVSPANLKDLITKTNSAGAFEDKVKPSEITKEDMELTEIKRLEAEAQKELAAAQEELKEAVGEETKVKDSLSRANADLKDAKTRQEKAFEDINDAEKRLLTAETSEEAEKIQKEIADANKAYDQATKDYDAANARGQELTSTLNNAQNHTNDTVWTEEGSKIKSDTYSALSKQMEGTYDATGDAMSAYGDNYDNIRSVVYDPSSEIVTFIADDPNNTGGKILVTYKSGGSPGDEKIYRESGSGYE